MFDAHLFSDSDAHVVHVMPVPDRFKEGIGKAKHQNILHGLFAQVVVDPEDLGFVKAAGEPVVQRSRRFQVIPDRFLDDHPRPFPVMHQSHLLEAWRDAAKQRRGVAR
jgi:hypothetical protein